MESAMEKIQVKKVLEFILNKGFKVISFGFLNVVIILKFTYQNLYPVVGTYLLARPYDLEADDKKYHCTFSESRCGNGILGRWHFLASIKRGYGGKRRKRDT
jgi:hypothetical protein